MRGLLPLALFALPFFVFSVEAHADSFCWTSQIRLCDGCTTTIYQNIVASTVPRPPIPGRPADRPWCWIALRSLGGDMHIQLTKPPTHGQFKSAGYKMWFKSAVVGTDSYSVDVTWRGMQNQILKGRIDSQVTVIPSQL